MNKLENDIVSWHKRTFPDATEDAVLYKIDEEVEEFSEECVWSDPTDKDYQQELSDVIITHIVYYARYCNISLEDVVRDKLKEVQSRYGS